MPNAIFLTASLTKQQFTSAWFYLTDQHCQGCEGQIELTDDAVVCSSPEAAFALNVLVEIPGFGKVVARTTVISARQRPYDLLTELIDGRIQQIEVEFQKNKAIANQFEPRLTAVKKNNSSMSMLSDLMKLGEDVAFINAQQQLQKRIAANETKDFLIGAQAFGIEKDQQYRQIHEQHFDLGIAPFYFFLLKPNSAAETNWELTDKIVDWLVKTRRPIKGHPLVWLHKHARPAWMLSLSFSELRNFLQQHIREVIERYGDRIHMWDIVNEMPAADANGFDFTMEQLLELTKMTSDLVHELQPTAERIINFSEIFGAKSYVHERPSIPPTHFLQLCEQHHIGYEAIGLQFYMGMKQEFTCRELLNISHSVDQFTQFHKPIHFSELGWPSQHDVDPNCFFATDHPEVGGRWHRGWDEALQAEFVEKIYTIFASKPLAKSITWWDLTDHGPHQDIGSRFLPFGGLTRRDYTPKPALLAIEKFRQELPGPSSKKEMTKENNETD